MDLSRFKKLKELLDQKKKALLRTFYKSEDFNAAILEIREQLLTNSIICLESDEQSSLVECAINSLLLVEREKVFKMYNQAVPSFHLFYEDLVVSKFYQETVMYSVEFKQSFLYKRGDINALAIN